MNFPKDSLFTENLDELDIKLLIIQAFYAYFCNDGLSEQGFSKSSR